MTTSVTPPNTATITTRARPGRDEVRLGCWFMRKSIASGPRLAQPLAAAVLLCACSGTRSAPPRALAPGGVISSVRWTEAELARPTAMREVRRTEHESHHLLRTTVSEKPHIHLISDLTVVVLSGNTRVHLETDVFSLQPGDLLHIPRGVPHWLELSDAGPARAYVIFSPPFNPDDRHLTR